MKAIIKLKNLIQHFLHDNHLYNESFIFNKFIQSNEKLYILICITYV